MAKSGKKKSGFHKDISSVLKGVPIPQGVRNWRPPDTSEKDRADDSSLSELSNISSVFKGITTESDHSRSTAEPQTQSYNTELYPAELPDEHPESRVSLITKLDCSEDSSTKAKQVKKHRPANRVASYCDPLMDIAAPSVGEQLQDEYLGSKKILGKRGRKALALSAPVFILIVILIYKYCFQSAPQQTEASAIANSGSPLVSTPEAINEIDWQVPEKLPARVIDLLEEPEEKAEQKKQKKELDEENKRIDLRAILFSEQKPSAIIGGQILYVGDKVDNAIITSITRDSVKFEKDGKIWTQKLRK